MLSVDLGFLSPFSTAAAFWGQSLAGGWVRGPGGGGGGRSELSLVSCTCRMSVGPRGSYALGSATYGRARKGMGSTCTVTSPGQDSISALWTQARRPLTLASVPRTDSSRYLSWRFQGVGCHQARVWAR